MHRIRRSGKFPHASRRFWRCVFKNRFLTHTDTIRTFKGNLRQGINGYRLGKSVHIASVLHDKLRMVYPLSIISIYLLRSPCRAVAGYIVPDPGDRIITVLIAGEMHVQGCTTRIDIHIVKGLHNIGGDHHRPGQGIHATGIGCRQTYIINRIRPALIRETVRDGSLLIRDQRRALIPEMPRKTFGRTDTVIINLQRIIRTDGIDSKKKLSPRTGFHHNGICKCGNGAGTNRTLHLEHHHIGCISDYSLLISYPRRINGITGFTIAKIPPVL